MFVVYLLVTQLNKTPRIEIDNGEQSTDTVADDDVGRFDSEKIGMVGDVGVGTVKKAKYIRLNKQRKVEREFGFEKLLHKEGDEWELEKPFMNVYRRNFKFYLTADKGRVQVETAVGRPSPKDATLTGNVVIRILPVGGSSIKESFIYLDNVIFISEKSQFSTAGPVEFINEDTQMLGKGLELVYNDELERLEFLRVIHMESLRLKTSERGLFSETASSKKQLAKTSELPLSQANTDRLAEASKIMQKDQSREPVAAKVPVKMSSTVSMQSVSVKQPESERYKCLFNENVIIETPEQLIFADEVFINNIVSGERTDKSETANTDTTEGAQDIPEKTAVPTQSEVDSIAAESTETDSKLIGKSNEPNGAVERFVDTIVTCNNGILVTPMDSTRSLKDFVKPKSRAETGYETPKNFGDESDRRTTFVARRIDHDMPTGNTFADGLSELKFYTDDVMSSEIEKTAVPVKITAQKKVEFLSASNQVVFEGNCFCNMLRAEFGIQQKYTLSAPKLTVDLSSGKATDIKHLTADGGVVNLATVKTTMAEEPHDKPKLLGGIELKCHRFDFDNAEQMFLATGPGIIKVDNSKAQQPKTDTGRFSLRKPCWALVENFDNLRYSLESNQIIADAKSQRISIGYIPIIDGQYGQVIKATASHVEANLIEVDDNQAELSTLSARGGVTYEEQVDKSTKRKRKGRAVQFVGSEMFYDASDSVITAWGNKSQPCMLNGAFAEGIEYDLKTGRAKAKIVGPGTLSTTR